MDAFTFRKPQSQVTVLLVTILVAMLKDCNDAWILIPPKVTVQIINNFHPPQDLTLHCKSKNDDKGEHTIKGGETYEFRFRPAPIVDITLYFCSFRWPSEPSLHYLDIYEERRDWWCKTCSWRAWEHGACIYNRARHYEQCISWTTKPQSTLTSRAVAPSSSNTTRY